VRTESARTRSGNLLIPKTLRRLTDIAAEMRAAGGPPSDELATRMHATQERLQLIGMIDIVLLVFGVVAMASARYL